MARYSVGIYWDDVFLHACLAKIGMSEFVIEKFVSLAREYSDHYVPGKKISEEIPLLLKGAFAESSDTYVVGVPERESMHRTLLRPFGDRKKISLTITPEMETLLPVMDGKIIVEYVLLGMDETGLHRIETMAVRHEAVKSLIEDLNSAGVDPEIIDSPSAAILAGARNVFRLEDDTAYLFLHLGWHDTSMAVLQGTGVLYTGIFPFGFEKILTGLHAGKAVPADQLQRIVKEGVRAGGLLDAYVREVLIALSRIDTKGHDLVLVPAGYAASVKDLGEAFRAAFDVSEELPDLREIHGTADTREMLRCFMPLSLACRGIDATDQVNFRKGDLANTRKLEQIREVAGAWMKVAVVFAVLWVLGLGLNIVLNARIDRQLTAAIQKEYSAVMPPGTPMTDDPVRYMEQHLARVAPGSGAGAAGGSDTPLEIIRGLSSSVPGSIDVVLDNIIIDEKEITLTGSAGSYDNVERMKEGLAGLPYISEVKIVSANVEKTDQRVKLRLVCSRKSNST